MGGRGSSGAGKRTTGTGVNGGSKAFYDLTANYAGMSLHQFENAIRDKKSEYLGGFDANGNLVVAGTSYLKGSVALPTGHPDFNKITTLTHNHPSNTDRPLGGTFSQADVKVLGTYPHLNSVRVVANGRGEHSYIMQKITGRANPQGLLNDAGSSAMRTKMRNMGNANMVRVQASVGRKLTPSEASRAYIGVIKKDWVDFAEKNGYTYTPLKKAPW